jgi:hypothetical protein
MACCLCAVLIAAVVGAGTTESRPATERSAADMPANPERAIDTMRRELDRFRRDHEPEIIAALACDFGKEGEEWFEWNRLWRNWPQTSPDLENAPSNYGISVAVSGNVAVVGSSRQVIFVDNDDPDEDDPIEILNSGTVYVFRFAGGEWRRVATIEPPMDTLAFRACGSTETNYIQNIRFGSAVAVASSPDRDVVVIGAPFEPFLFYDEDDNGICVNGGLPQSGAVYVYERTGAVAPDVEEEEWERMSGVSENFHQGVENPQIIMEDRLWSNFPFEGSRFGTSVSILPFRLTEEGWVGGDMLAGGAPTAIAFPNCEEADNPGWFSGTVTTFQLGGELPGGGTFPGEWVMGDSLTSECIPFDQFGANVTMAYSRDRERPTILSGVVQGIAWVEEEDPKDPKNPDLIAIPLAGTVLLFEFDPPEDDDDDNGGKGGMALEGDDGEKKEEEYVPSWVLKDVLQSPHPRIQEFFGQSVALLTSPVDNDAVVVGARRAHTEVDKEGNSAIDTENEGAVFIFRRHFLSDAAMEGEDKDPEYEWELEQKLISIDPQTNGWFGESVSGFANTIVVGAPREGMDDPSDPKGFFDAVGFAYVFSYDRELEEWDPIGQLLLPYGPTILNPFDQFGASVAMSGSVIVVGSPGSKWVFPDPDTGDPVLFNGVGAAYTYGRCFDCQSPQDCQTVGELPGCQHPDCCNAVCQFDPFCCEVAWDQQCVDLAMMFPELCDSPIQNCPAAGSCCQMHDTPGCNDEDCCIAVCDVDLFCCEVNWDACCVALAGELCAAQCPDIPDPSCEGFCGLDDADGCGTCSCAPDCGEGDNLPCCDDVCTYCIEEPGFQWCPVPECPGMGSCCEVDITPGCEEESCCDAVCEILPECCLVEWGECCVSLASELCSDICPDSGPSCFGQCGVDDPDGCGTCSCAPDCGEGDNLPCCDDVCDYCDEEPGFEWCNIEPPDCPGFGNCCIANGSAGCSDEACCFAVCFQDPFCCEVDWDSCCARLAEELCALCPPSPDPSCEGFCGVPDADGCGTCSCAPDCIDDGNCCEDVCTHCSNEPGFDWCPSGSPGNDQRPQPRPIPSSFSDKQPLPAPPPHGPVRDDYALGTSGTAPKRR